MEGRNPAAGPVGIFAVPGCVTSVRRGLLITVRRKNDSQPENGTDNDAEESNLDYGSRCCEP